MKAQRLFTGLAIITLLLPALLTSSLTTQAAEPPRALKAIETTNGPALQRPPSPIRDGANWHVQAGTALMRVAPVTSTVMTGQTFTVTVTISDVVDLSAFEFKMTYDSAVVHVEDVALGPFLGSTGLRPSPLGPNIDNEGGTMSFGAYTLGDEPGPEGSGVLAEITLIAQWWGITSLDLYDVQIVDAETETVTVEDGEVSVVPNTVYPPLLLRRWPPIPETSTLHAISNPGGDGSYTVQWTSAERATSYVLQEARRSDLGDWSTVHSGAATSYSADGRGPARYRYRVKARNSSGDSDWSNVEWVDVLWEAEPNDDALTEANGPIVSGLTYYGTFPSAADERDYFTFDLPAAHSVELWLTHIPSGQDYDLALRDAGLDLVALSDEFGNEDEHILTDALPPGRYYVQVVNYSEGGSPQPYYLRVVYAD